MMPFRIDDDMAIDLELIAMLYRDEKVRYTETKERAAVRYLKVYLSKDLFDKTPLLVMLPGAQRLWDAWLDMQREPSS